MAVGIRTWVTFVEDIQSDGGRALDRPLRRVAVAAVLSNPQAGLVGGSVELTDRGVTMGDELPRRCPEALGDEAEACGKGGIVGEHGALEHVPAVLHPKFGAPARGCVAGESILPSVKQRGGQGATLDPLHHIKAMLVRSHFDAIEIGVPDAPGADELLFALAVSKGDRPHARIGGLKAEDVGEPALIPTAPAILTAIRDATGARVSSVPATPDRVRAALLELGSAARADGPRTR